MKRIDVYVKEAQYEEWKRIAEGKGQSLSDFVKEMVAKGLAQGVLEQRIEKLEEKMDGRFKEMDNELNVLWGITGQLDDALKKLNHGEKLEDRDFVYHS
jgi:hypothetical protein